MATNFDFRILIDTISGSQYSYGTASFVNLQNNTSQVINTSEAVSRINNMHSMSFFNGKTNRTGSALFASVGSFKFSGSTGIDSVSSDYQYVSAEVNGDVESGSILFKASTSASSDGDLVKRYKFFGNKVCNVLGVPENYWIYADKFRLTNTGSEQNYLSGDILAQSIHLRDNFAISNAGSIETDIPFKHFRDTDRWVKWTDVSSSLPSNDMLIGYSNLSDKYMIRMQNNEDLIISSSTITASNDIFLPNGDLIGNLTSTKLSNINQLEVNTIIGTDDDTDTGISFSGNDAIVMLAGGITAFNITGHSTPPAIALGNSSTDINLRVDAGAANSFFITSSNQNIGIGTDTPGEKLTIQSGNISASLNSTGSFGLIEAEGGMNVGGRIEFPNNKTLGNADVDMLRVSTTQDGNDQQLGFTMRYSGSRAGVNNSLHIFADNQSAGAGSFKNNLTMLQDGKVAIGDDGTNAHLTPDEMLHVIGNAKIDSDLTVGGTLSTGTFNPSTISTNVFTASTNALIGNNDSLDTSPTGTPILQVRRGNGSNNHINFFADSSGCYMISDDPATNQKDLYIAASPTGDDNTDRDIIFQTGKTSGDFIERMRIFGEGQVRILNGDLKFSVFSGNTHGIDFDGAAAIRFDEDNNKVLIERTDGIGQPNQPIITIPTNTSSDLVATVEGNISASLPVLAPTPICFRCGASQTSGHVATFLGFGHDSSGNFREDNSPDANAQDSRVVAPFDGYVHSVVLRADSAAGTTCTMQIFKAIGGVNSDAIDASLNQLGAARIKDQNTADFAVRYEFGTDYTFLAGDMLAIKWDSDASGNDVDGNLILMCTPTNGL